MNDSLNDFLYSFIASNLFSSFFIFSAFFIAALFSFILSHKISLAVFLIRPAVNSFSVLPSFFKLSLQD